MQSVTATAPPTDTSVPLESILCTAELNRRPVRPPDYETENRALGTLVQALADSPESILQKLADTILETLRCHSAGLSLLAEDGKKFYWPAIAGAWKPHAGGGTPRDFGPCGDVLDRNAPLLFKRFERRYPYLLKATPTAEEALLIPFYAHGKAVGTIWAMAHDDRRKFDAEDLRQLESLGRFASAAYQAVQLEQVRESRRAAFNLMEDAVLSRQAVEKLNLELRESEERFRTLFELGPVAVYSCDAAGVIQNFNRRAGELWGRKPAIGDTDERFCGSFKLFRPDGSFMPHDQCPMAEVVSGKIPEARDAEVLIERPDGSWITVVVNIRPLKNERGEVTGGINCFYDITDRKRAEEIRARLAAIVESSADAIVGKDLNGVIQTWNSGAEQLFGYTAEEAIGQSITILIPPDRIEEEPVILERIRRGERIEHFETVRRRKDGTLVDISLTISPIVDGRGRITGASKIARDVTERKRSEDQLRSLNQDLKYFAFATSHDLQEPLRMVSSYTQLLARKYKGKLDERADQYVSYAVEGAERMQTMLSALREYWSVSEKGQRQPAPVDCNAVLDSALEFLGLKLEESGGTVTHDSLPTVQAEEIPLTLLLQNLVGNALKYRRPAEPPRVHVSAGRNGNLWTFSVTDNGLGIEAEFLQAIFVPFKRLHGSDHPGSGIGLAICQKIVERYGGKIWAESEYGKGTTFRFTIPA